MDDPYNLRRFVDAQEPVYRQVLAELAAGAKRGHWIWFIFPQLKGLGHTAMADRFGIGSLLEARAFQAVLDRYYGGEPDSLTLGILRRA